MKFVLVLGRDHLSDIAVTLPGAGKIMGMTIMMEVGGRRPL